MARWLDSLSSLGRRVPRELPHLSLTVDVPQRCLADALDEIAAVCTDLDGYTGWVCGHAYYQLGEVRRLRGEWGCRPSRLSPARRNMGARQPGLALLRLAEQTSTPRQPASVGR